MLARFFFKFKILKIWLVIDSINKSLVNQRSLPEDFSDAYLRETYSSKFTTYLRKAIADNLVLHLLQFVIKASYSTQGNKLFSVCNSWRHRPLVPMKPSTLPFRQSALCSGPSYGNGGSLQTFAHQSLNQFQMPKVNLKKHSMSSASLLNKTIFSAERVTDKPGPGYGSGHLSKWFTCSQGRQTA